MKEYTQINSVAYFIFLSNASAYKRGAPKIPCVCAEEPLLRDLSRTPMTPIASSLAACALHGVIALSRRAKIWWKVRVRKPIITNAGRVLKGNYATRAASCVALCDLGSTWVGQLVYIGSDLSSIERTRAPNNCFRLDVSNHRCLLPTLLHFTERARHLPLNKSRRCLCFCFCLLFNASAMPPIDSSWDSLYIPLDIVLVLLLIKPEAVDEKKKTHIWSHMRGRHMRMVK